MAYEEIGALRPATRREQGHSPGGGGAFGVGLPPGSWTCTQCACLNAPVVALCPTCPLYDVRTPRPDGHIVPDFHAWWSAVRLWAERKPWGPLIAAVPDGGASGVSGGGGDEVGGVGGCSDRNTDGGESSAAEGEGSSDAGGSAGCEGGCMGCGGGGGGSGGTGILGDGFGGGFPGDDDDDGRSARWSGEYDSDGGGVDWGC